jgi:hypothetical protein
MILRLGKMQPGIERMMRQCNYQWLKWKTFVGVSVSKERSAAGDGMGYLLLHVVVRADDSFLQVEASRVPLPGNLLVAFR